MNFTQIHYSVLYYIHTGIIYPRRFPNTPKQKALLTDSVLLFCNDCTRAIATHCTKITKILYQSLIFGTFTTVNGLVQSILYQDCTNQPQKRPMVQSGKKFSTGLNTIFAQMWKTRLYQNPKILYHGTLLVQSGVSSPKPLYLCYGTVWYSALYHNPCA